MKRRLWLAPLGLLLLIPSAAAQSTADLASDSPASLFGIVRMDATGLLLYHHSTANGTLTGHVNNGTVVDRTVHEDPCSHNRVEEERPLLTASQAGSTPPIEFQLVAGSMAVIDFATVKNFPVAQGPSTKATQADAPPVAYVGPNPYNFTGSTAELQGRSPLEFARAFPPQPFLTIPAGRFLSTAAGTLYVEAGALQTTQNNFVATWASNVERREVVSCTPATLPAGPVSTQQVTYYHSIRIYMENGDVQVQQGDLAPTLSYLQNKEGLTDPLQGKKNPPPRGYWTKDDAQGLKDAYRGYALPATMLVAKQFELPIQGAAKFQNAEGTLTEQSALTEIHQPELVLGGTLRLAPQGASDGGRRMSSHLSGELLIVTTPQGNVQDWGSVAAGAAGGAILLGAAMWVWPSLKWRSTQLFLFPLYARLKKEDILENPLRDDILQVVADSPGISASELGRRLDCGWGTLVYHLTVLERMNLVSSAREGRHKRFFVQGRINYSDKGAVGILANPAARTILDAVRATPGLIQKDLSERLGLSAGTIAWHVERLAGQGLLVKEEDGRTVRYYPSERLLDLTRRLAA